MSYHFPIRVYYEDTDAGGVVYYANYLKYAERARTEVLREIGIEQSALRAEHQLLFVVRSVDMELKKPAYLDDEVTVDTHIWRVSGASLEMMQSIRRGEEVLVEVSVKIACITTDFHPARIPGEIREKFATQE